MDAIKRVGRTVSLYNLNNKFKIIYRGMFSLHLEVPNAMLQHSIESTLSADNDVEIIDAFNSTSRYLE